MLKYQCNRCSMCENENCFGTAFIFDRQNPSGSKFPKIQPCTRLTLLGKNKSNIQFSPYETQIFRI